MKEIIIIFSLLFVSITLASAQIAPTDLRRRLIVGLKAGANISNVYDAQGEEFQADPKVGFIGGGFLAIPIGTYIGIQPEVHYSQRGFKSTGRILNGPYTLSRTSGNLDIPLLFAVKPAGFLTIVVGPQISFLLSQTDRFANATTTIQQEQVFQNDNYRKNTLSFVCGLDFNIGHVVIGARGGLDAQKNHADGSYTTPRYKNIWCQATLGYRFYYK